MCSLLSPAPGVRVQIEDPPTQKHCPYCDRDQGTDRLLGSTHLGLRPIPGFHNLQRGRAGEGCLPRGPHSSDTGILPERQQRGSFARFPRVCTHIT